MHRQIRGSKPSAQVISTHVMPLVQWIYSFRSQLWFRRVSAESYRTSALSKSRHVYLNQLLISCTARQTHSVTYQSQPVAGLTEATWQVLKYTLKKWFFGSEFYITHYSLVINFCLQWAVLFCPFYSCHSPDSGASKWTGYSGTWTVYSGSERLNGLVMVEQRG